jgi:integrase
LRRANGEGSIFKLSGKRRKPWAVRITAGYEDSGKQIYKYVGYYPTKTEAKNAMREYIVNPFNLDHKSTKLKDVYDRWSDHAELAQTTLRSYKSAFDQAKQLHNMNMRDIKAAHLEAAMDQMKPHMRSVFKNAMGKVYAYAIKHEIVDKDLISLISVKTTVATKEKTPFTLAEINKLKTFKHPLNDTVFILLYTGLRITELLEIKCENVHLEERYMIGGKKTKAGQNRVIPIHDSIYPLIKARYERGHRYLITKDNKKINYPTYRANYWNKMNYALGFRHTPHDTRHTFTTFADRCNVHKVALKRILGHTLNDMTDHYTHKDLDELLTEVNKIKY